MAKMWAGRTSGQTDKLADDFNSSIHFDCRMYKHDIKGSMAHAAMLAKQGIISSDGQHIWHINWLYNFPEEAHGRYDTVVLEEIDEYEYKQLRALNMKTPEEIIDEYTLLLIEGGIL